jgi:hypothetical protein
MATKDLSELMLMPSSGVFGTSTGLTVDAATEWVGYSFTADRTGNIDRIKVRSRTLTGTSPTWAIGLEAGVISGTWLGATNNGYGTVIVGAAGFHEITFGESVAVTRGTRYNAVIRYSSGTINGSNSVAWNAYVASNTQAHPSVPYNQGSNTRTSQWPIVSMRYDDGEWQTGMAAAVTSSVSWSSSSSPKWRGNKFVAPCSFTANKVMLGMRGNAGGDYNIVIVEGAGTAADLSITVDVDAQANGAVSHLMIDLGDDFAFTEGTTYRVFVEPTTTTAINSIIRYEFDTNAEKVAMFGVYEYTTATALGTNTDTDTQCIPLCVVPKSFESGSGGRVGFGSFG